jgi:hypothetical protein
MRLVFGSDSDDLSKNNRLVVSYFGITYLIYELARKRLILHFLAGYDLCSFPWYKNGEQPLTKAHIAFEAEPLICSYSFFLMNFIVRTRSRYKSNVTKKKAPAGFGCQ